MKLKFLKNNFSAKLYFKDLPKYKFSRIGFFVLTLFWLTTLITGLAQAQTTTPVEIYYSSSTLDVINFQVQLDIFLAGTIVFFMVILILVLFWKE